MLKQLQIAAGGKIRAIMGVVPENHVEALHHMQRDAFGRIVPPEMRLPEDSPEVAKLMRTVKRQGFSHVYDLPLPYTLCDMMTAGISALLQAEGVKATSIDAIISVTQNPDYIAPGNSYFYQERLGFSPDTFCLDLGSSCAGLFNGLITSISLLNSMGLKRVLLVVGESWSMEIPHYHYDNESMMTVGGGLVLLERGDAEDTESSAAAGTDAAAAASAQCSSVLSPSTLSFAVNSFGQFAEVSFNKGYSLRHLRQSTYARAHGLEEPQFPHPNMMQSISSSRKAQDTAIEQLVQLLNLNGLKLSDLSAGIAYSAQLQANLALRTSLKDRIAALLDGSAGATGAAGSAGTAPTKQAEQLEQADDAIAKAVLDVQRPDFFPFAMEPLGHMSSAMIPVMLSYHADLAATAQKGPTFFNANGAGLEVASMIANLSATKIHPLHVYCTFADD